MIQNLVYNLCESFVENIGGVADIGKKTPTPIYLTQWKIVGNSEVHTDPYLTSWKVSGNSQVHTLPYPDGVVLPTGYKRCKYLTFDGSSYIDTGIIPEQGIGVSIKFKFLEEIDGDDGIFGCRASAWSADSFYCFRQGSASSGMLFVSYGGKICDSTSTDNFVINANDEIKLHLDSSFLSFTNGTNTLTKSISSQITKGTKTLYIGAVNGYGRKPRILLRTFVLTNGVGNTIFNGIPCLDDNNVPCLYDTVSGTSFYNDGTGTFGYEIEPQPTEIWSCGDLGQDGKYHVKISNGVNVYDIPLTAPLRKVNNVVDTIEVPSGTEGKALITRNIAIAWWKNLSIVYELFNNQTVSDYERFYTTSLKGVIGNTSGINTNICLSANYEQHTTPVALTRAKDRCMCVYDKNVYIRDIDCHSKADFEAKNANNYFFYVLATPTTELVDAPQIAVSPINTYTSANVTPYSAFEHTKHSEIWSCGEYNATDGKYHILVQPQGGSIADIALDEPLKKVNDVADTIKFPNGPNSDKAWHSRFLISFSIDKFNVWKVVQDRKSGLYSCLTTFICTDGVSYSGRTLPNLLCNKIKTVLSANDGYAYNGECIMVNNGKRIIIHNPAIEPTVEAYQSYFDSLGAIEIIYPRKVSSAISIDVPKIQKANTYNCIISQSAKAINWSSFETK